jgi:hypothetical protein
MIAFFPQFFVVAQVNRNIGASGGAWAVGGVTTAHTIPRKRDLSVVFIRINFHFLELHISAIA